jgi:hypothetical protein
MTAEHDEEVLFIVGRMRAVTASAATFSLLDWWQLVAQVEKKCFSKEDQSGMSVH